MALADTAHLVVQIGLDDRVTPGLGRVNSSLSRFSSGISQVGKGVGQLGAGLGNIATRLGIAAVAAGYFIERFTVSNLEAGIKHIRDLELVIAQTNAVLLSTKDVSGQTVGSIEALSAKFESLNATIDKKVIQSAENLLLSFTNIPKKAFEPTLQAALNLNQALGGGPDGLQGQLIKVAKAVNDPVSGLTLLSRVGVQFTKAEKDKIKALVGSNQLYAAQQIVIDKLTTKFGGQFAAAGNTAAGRVALLHARVRDLQMTFAGPFAFVLDNIVGKLDKFLGETGTMGAARNLGQAIASIFSNSNLDAGINVLRRGLALLSQENLAKAGSAIKGAFEFVKNIDWATLGRVLSVTGRVAKTVIDAFMALPPWIQAAVIAGLAVNKLSGGLAASGIGNIAGGLIKIAFSQFGNRGATPLNPVFVSSVGGIGGPGGPGGVPLIVTAAVAGTALAGTLFSAGSNADIGTQEQMVSVAAHTVGATMKDILGTGATLGAIAAFAKDPTLRIGVDPKLLAAVDALAAQLNGPTPTGPGSPIGHGPGHPTLAATVAAGTSAKLREGGTQAVLASTAMIAAGQKDLSDKLRPLPDIGESSRLTAQRLAATVASLKQAGDTLHGIARKPTTFIANVTNNISARLSVVQALATMSLVNQIRSNFAPGDTTGGFL